MSKCLCCGKPLSLDDQFFDFGWHKRCAKKFFGTEVFPSIEFTPKSLEQLASDAVNKRLTIPGVQKKLSLHFSKSDESRLTLVDYPAGFILKPQTAEYECLPEAEQMVMLMADACKIQTVPHALIEDGSGSYSYITKRIDRTIKAKNVDCYAMEDFCQLDGRLTADKYKSSYERCTKIICSYSARPGLDLVDFFIRIVFSFIVGNSDMHLKNFSLVESSPGSRIFGLSPAYDMLPVSLVMPEDTEELALTMCGKKSNFKKSDFLKFASVCNINEERADKFIESLVSKSQVLVDIVDDSHLSTDLKDSMKDLISSRVKRLNQV